MKKMYKMYIVVESVGDDIISKNGEDFSEGVGIDFGANEEHVNDVVPKILEEVAPKTWLGKYLPNN